MKYDVVFKWILREFRLGALTAEPRTVSGGYMHNMYHLETEAGVYAVKLLNPSIMRRPDAMGNFLRAEGLEQVLLEHKIPVVPAMELKGCKMQCVERQYFYVFPWVEGTALGLGEIELKHCKSAGSLLAGIHKIDPGEVSFTRELLSIDWDAYIELASESGSEIAEELKRCRELLYLGQTEFNSALTSLPSATCICDGDMDSKNVLWVNENPVIIDLECLDYGNPFMEMLQLALSWSGDVLCCINFEFLDAFLSSYQQEYGDFHLDWASLYGIGFIWLEWLEYNIKRALMIEGETDAERELGICQVHQTIQRIIYYHSVREELVGHLMKRR